MRKRLRTHASRTPPGIPWSKESEFETEHTPRALEVGDFEGDDSGGEQGCIEHECLPPGLHRAALAWIGWRLLLRDASLDGDAGGSGA